MGSLIFHQSDSMDALKEFLWDSETKTVMGRSAASWFKITVFYCIYYTCIGFFAIACLNGYRGEFVIEPSAENGAPTIQTRVGTPGLSMSPGAEIMTIKADRSGISQNIDKVYNKLSNTRMYEDDEIKSQEEAIFKNLGDCSVLCEEGETCPMTNAYKNGEPCVFFQVNKVINWQPYEMASLNAVYNTPRFGENSVISDAVAKQGDKFEQGQIYLTCFDRDWARQQGQSEAQNQKEKVLVDSPNQRFDTLFYSSDLVAEGDSEAKTYGVYKYKTWPIKDSNAAFETLNPFVAAQIKVKEEYLNQQINVACQVYAGNMSPNEKYGLAYTAFQLTVESEAESSQNDFREKFVVES